MGTRPTLSCLYFRGVTFVGRQLRKVMWKLLRFRSGPVLHPKHRALPKSHHQWYLENVQSGWLVADLGCDRGGHSIALAEAGCRVVGVEKSDEALRNAVKHRDIEYRQGDLEQPLPLNDEVFDAVIALDVIEHLEARERFLAEIRRVLRPGGLLFLSAPNKLTRWKTTARQCGIFQWSDPDHKIEFSRDELDALLADAGFEAQSVSPVVFDTPFEGWIDFVGGISLSLYRRLWERKRAAALADPEQSTGFRVIAEKNGT